MREVSTQEVVAFRQEVRRLLGRRLLEAVEVVLEEELSEALGSGWYERSAVRRGYRNGVERRRITTVAGTREVSVPRGRIAQARGSSVEFRSRLLPRYVNAG